MIDKREELSEGEEALCIELTNQLVEIAQTIINEGFHTGSEVIEIVRQALPKEE